MPRRGGLQQITFSIERDEDQGFTRWIWVPVKRGDTVAKVAARRGHPEDARRIADENGVRSVNSSFSGRGLTKIKVPGELRQALSFHALAGDEPPRVTGGYAKLVTVDRPERVGLTTFEGYDPISLEVPIRFRALRGAGGGVELEQDIALLERMAGRGNFSGTGVGPPPIIRLATTGPSGEVVPLIPRNYQWSLQNKTGPLWRIAGIDWDANPRRNAVGNRTEQKATVTVQQHTNIVLLSRSVAERAKSKQKARR